MNINIVVAIIWVLTIIVGYVWWLRASKRDPLYSCPRYLTKGCSHIDGILCDMDKCNIKDIETCDKCLVVYSITTEECPNCGARND